MTDQQLTQLNVNSCHLHFMKKRPLDNCFVLFLLEWTSHFQCVVLGTQHVVSVESSPFILNGTL